MARVGESETADVLFEQYRTHMDRPVSPMTAAAIPMATQVVVLVLRPLDDDDDAVFVPVPGEPRPVHVVEDACEIDPTTAVTGRVGSSDAAEESDADEVTPSADAADAH